MSTAKLRDLDWANYRDTYYYPTSPEAPRSEINRLQNVFCSYSIEPSNLFLSCSFTELPPEQAAVSHHFREPVLMLCITGFNAAHLLSHIISFVNFYSDLAREMPLLASQLRIAIPGEMQSLLPHIVDVFKRLLPSARLLLLQADTCYAFDLIILRRNTWFTWLEGWQKLKFVQTADTLTFADLSWVLQDFSDDLRPLMDLVKCVYEDNRHRFPVCEKIILFKLADGSFMQTPRRAIVLSEEAKSLAVESDFKFISPSQFTSLEEYLVTLYSARTVVFSYGGATCTNRFFLHPKASVLLVAHESYRDEWNPNPPGQEFFHICHSHICPVSQQRVLLHVPDTIDAAIMATIIQNAHAISEPPTGPNVTL